MTEKLNIELQLKPIVLPDTKIDLIEQFALALQNRDSIGLEQLINKKGLPHWLRRDTFTEDFTGYCDKMDKKHGGVYVHTVPGTCGRAFCNKGTIGLGVSVNTIKDNKLLWRFNLILRETNSYTLDIWLCQEFMVNHEEIPS
jgi:hypothetical protein